IIYASVECSKLLCDVPQVGIYDDSCGTNPKKPDLSDKRFSSNRDVCRQLFLRELGNGEPKTEDIPDLHNVTLEHFEKYIAEVSLFNVNETCKSYKILALLT
ncbi:unnamed protein product, partial [Dicrocoelium dendriticum]